jgi:hypothetical protein
VIDFLGLVMVTWLALQMSYNDSGRAPWLPLLGESVRR